MFITSNFTFFSDFQNDFLWDHKTRTYLIKGEGLLLLSDRNTYLTMCSFLYAPFSCLPALFLGPE